MKQEACINSRGTLTTWWQEERHVGREGTDQGAGETKATCLGILFTPSKRRPGLRQQGWPFSSTVYPDLLRCFRLIDVQLSIAVAPRAGS